MRGIFIAKNSTVEESVWTLSVFHQGYPRQTDVSNQVIDLTKDTSPIRCFLGLIIQCLLSSTCFIHTALVQNKQQVQWLNFSVLDNGVPGFDSLHVLGLVFFRTRTGFILSFLVNSFLLSTWKWSPLLTKHLHSKPHNSAHSLIF